MLKSVLNKIANNIWLFICLTIGSLMITAILSSIPIYTDGALRKMLNTELNNYQAEKGKSAGQYYTSISFGSDYTSNGALNLIEESREILYNSLEKEGVNSTVSFESAMVRLINSRGDGMEFTSAYDMRYMTGLENHIDIVEGRMFSDSFDGVFEVIVSNQAYNTNRIHLGQVYSMGLPMIRSEDAPRLQIKVVGVFDIIYGDGDFWYDADDGYDRTFFCSPDSFKAGMFNHNNAKYITRIAYFHNVDFYGMETSDLNAFFKVYSTASDYLDNFQSGHKQISFPLRKTVINYVDKGWQMELTLWVFNAPVIVMLAYYLFMVARLIIEEDKNEISALKSRGAEPKQIFSRYVLECGIIILISLILGPPLGLALAQVIGSANGFLEFINRSGLSLKLLPVSYLYALLAGLLFMIMVLIPAYNATKITIVQHKQKKARKSTKPFWEKAFLDVILFVISVFLLYIYSNHGVMLFSSSGSVDPTIYFISTLFIISCGMLFLRIYPYILKLIFVIRKKRMKPTVYATFVQVSRSGNDNRFLIMFLILTISIGIYSSTSARIINNNVDEVSAYKCGADVVVYPDWESMSEKANTTNAEEVLHISLNDFASIDAFENYTQVTTVDSSRIKSVFDYDWYNEIRIMAIDPYQFSQVVDFRPSLLDIKTDNPIHWYYYLNLMQDYPTSVLISRGISERLDIKVGSTLEVDVNQWGTPEEKRVPTMNCYVLGILDYWPNYYDGAILTDVTNELIVMNRTYLSSVKNDVTYDLWFKLKEGKTSKDALAAFEEKNLMGEISTIKNKSDFIQRGKNDSMTLALNGSLSLGFVATMLISFVGFLLYWIMNMRKRKLQFGILRAMGLSRGKVTFMLTLEHLLTSGVAMLIGILIGNITARLFMPILSQTYTSLLPLKLSYNIQDTTRIFIIVLAMILIGIAILNVFIRKLKINEAVKIGED